MVQKLNVGIIGLGYIGKVHAQAYRSIPLAFPAALVLPELKAVWRTSLGRDEEFIRSCNFETITTDLDEFFRAPLDLIDVCTPTGMHTEFVTAAAQHGKAIYCEKPLGLHLADARQMSKLAENTGVPTRVAFVMRYIPAIGQMKSLLDSGELGEVLNFRAHMFHSSYLNPNRPMAWRLRKSQSGGGAFADLGAHLLDLVQYLLGNPCAIQAQMRTFIKQRPVKAGSSEMETVDVDDWVTCTLELDNGVLGQLEAARTAGGVPDETVFQVFCRKGSLFFNSNSPEMLSVYNLQQDKWVKGVFEESPQENERPISSLWPPSKVSMGYLLNAHLSCQYDFLQSIAAGKPCGPDFQSAVNVQQVLEAGYASASKSGRKIALLME